MKMIPPNEKILISFTFAPYLPATVLKQAILKLESLLENIRFLKAVISQSFY
jgi:hypothetical protein